MRDTKKLPTQSELDKALEFQLTRAEGDFGRAILQQLNLPDNETNGDPMTPEGLKLRVFQMQQALDDARAPRVTNNPEAFNVQEQGRILQMAIWALQGEMSDAVMKVLSEGVDRREMARKVVEAQNVFNGEIVMFDGDGGNGKMSAVAMMQKMLWDEILSRVKSEAISQ